MADDHERNDPKPGKGERNSYSGKRAKSQPNIHAVWAQAQWFGQPLIREIIEQPSVVKVEDVSFVEAKVQEERQHRVEHSKKQYQKKLVPNHGKNHQLEPERKSSGFCMGLRSTRLISTGAQPYPIGVSVSVCYFHIHIP